MSPALHRTLVSLRDRVAETGKASAPLVLAKALETMWMLSDVALAAEPRPISEDTRRAVDRARSILESNMAEPPDLETLAAEVGMSLSKLKEVFPRVCGMPPYAYLRRIRMDRARRLLAGRRLSVTEAAMEVGYANLSHFAKAFAAHHGVKPSQVAQGGRTMHSGF
jgi:AraC-like DNA-binding protein